MKEGYYAQKYNKDIGTGTLHVIMLEGENRLRAVLKDPSSAKYQVVRVSVVPGMYYGYRYGTVLVPVCSFLKAFKKMCA